MRKLVRHVAITTLKKGVISGRKVKVYKAAVISHLISASILLSA